MRKCTTALVLSILLILIFVNGCALNNTIKEDKNNMEITTPSKTSEPLKDNKKQPINDTSVDNFNLHIFTDKRDNIIPCYYWTFLIK